MSPRSVLPTGMTLDQSYEIRRLIGAGGFGLTYEAFDRGLGRHVAIKEFYPTEIGIRDGSQSVRPRSEKHGAIFEKLKASFIREAQTLSRFEHPAIVRVFRVFESHGTAYMVMSLERGVTLRDWLSSLGRSPTQRELDRIAAPLLGALEMLHAAHYLHRDIAPDNIIVHDDGTPVLLDFGATRRVVAELTSDVTGLVKRGYSPMEQYAVDSRAQGPWTDIYALGATLYRCVSGREPQEATLRVLDDTHPPAARLSASTFRAAFLAGIDLAMALRPEARPQSIAELRRLLLPDLDARDHPPAAASLGGPTDEAASPPSRGPGGHDTEEGRRPARLSDDSAPPRRPTQAPARWRRPALMAVALAAIAALAAATYVLGPRPSPTASSSGGTAAAGGSAPPPVAVSAAETGLPPSPSAEAAIGAARGASARAEADVPPLRHRSPLDREPASQDQIDRWREAAQPLALKLQAINGVNFYWTRWFAAHLSSLSDGKLKPELLGPGAVVPNGEQLDAVSSGRLAIAWGNPAFFADQKTAALHIFGGQVPTGLDRDAFIGWLRDRGLAELNALYQNDLGLAVHTMTCAVSWPEGMWLKQPVADLAAFRRLRMRTAGLPLRVMRHMGVAATFMETTRIADALSSGAVDAAENADPFLDTGGRYWRFAKHYYYPSFHGPVTHWTLDVNLAQWQSLSDAQRGLLVEACRRNMDQAGDYAPGIDRALDLYRREGVTLAAFPGEIVAAARTARDEVIVALGSADPRVARAWASYTQAR